jgi:hypothetical protein
VLACFSPTGVALNPPLLPSVSDVVSLSVVFHNTRGSSPEKIDAFTSLLHRQSGDLTIGCRAETKVNRPISAPPFNVVSTGATGTCGTAGGTAVHYPPQLQVFSESLDVRCGKRSTHSSSFATRLNLLSDNAASTSHSVTSVYLSPGLSKPDFEHALSELDSFLGSGPHAPVSVVVGDFNAHGERQGQVVALMHGRGFSWMSTGPTYTVTASTPEHPAVRSTLDLAFVRLPPGASCSAEVIANRTDHDALEIKVFGTGAVDSRAPSKVPLYSREDLTFPIHLLRKIARSLSLIHI